ncbi:hypothetical protein COV12_03060 [Candidatus Woesearchaeota archaeon CG10_big_fil_rev_8_21_14_0_10_32_24]|nr:MAG: hypothetical protein COV12_03060 [Candidatus Woesearchaeota archaeon CG10_big_fil_rev_8_21_14_0_10_32_24]
MGKKCVECGEEAKYKIKDSSEYYCGECAEEHFGDLDLLVVLEDEAQKLKDYVNKKLAPQEEEEFDQD